MNRNAMILVVLAVVLVGIGLRRVGSGNAPAGAEERDAFRVMVCRKCQALEVATAESIRRRYAEEKVGKGPGGAAFGCESCGEIAANVVQVDMESQRIDCSGCDWRGPERASSVRRLIESEKAQGTERGTLAFRCSACKKFTAVLNSIPQEEKE